MIAHIPPMHAGHSLCVCRGVVVVHVHGMSAPCYRPAVLHSVTPCRMCAMFTPMSVEHIAVHSHTGSASSFE